MMKAIDIEIGMAMWSKANHSDITWICSNVARSRDGDIVIEFVQSYLDFGRASFENGTKTRLYLSEVMEYMTCNYFKSAPYLKREGK